MQEILFDQGFPRETQKMRDFFQKNLLFLFYLVVPRDVKSLYVPLFGE